MMNIQSPHGTEEWSTKNWRLNYLFYRNVDDAKFSYSFDPKDSDSFQNTSILSPLISTLFKYDDSGKNMPYLAESFNVSSDNKVWNFKIRNGLFCNDQFQTPINAKNFAENFKASLRRYKHNGDLLDFSYLKNIDFLDDPKKFNGISYDELTNIIKFEFTRPPSDLLEFLRMPYFGMWCKSDFKDKNQMEWIAPDLITSSNSYIISKKEKEFLLVKNINNHLMLNESSPKEIKFSIIRPFELNGFKQKSTIIEFTKKPPQNLKLEGMTHVKGPPTILLSLVLNNNSNGIFSNLRNRQILQSRINKARSIVPEFSSTFFYFNATSKVNEVDLSNEKIDLGNNLPVITIAGLAKSFNQEDLDKLQFLLEQILKDSGIKVKFEINEENENNWLERVFTGKEFDGRIATVDIGGHVINAAIKMMFCSKMGINFSDPSGEICKLVDLYDLEGGSITESYISKFNQAIINNATVIPLYHYGVEWFVSDDIDPSSLSITVTSQAFEKIKLKSKK